MRKLFILISLLLICGKGTCQKTKRVVNRKGCQVIEKYFVLKSDKSIKHGKYYSYFPIPRKVRRKFKKKEFLKYSIKESGYYQMGQKDSTWFVYRTPPSLLNGKIKGKPPHMIKTYGSYENGLKEGMWTTGLGNASIRHFHHNGEKEVSAIFINPKYPEYEKKKGIEGIVVLEFKINSDCSITDIIVIESLTTNCDKAAIEAVKELTNKLISSDVECEDEIITQRIPFRLM